MSENEAVRHGVGLAALELCWLLGMAIAPLLLWHRILSDVLGSFRVSLSYFVGELGPWFLLLAGIAFLVPVAVSAGLHPESRAYPRGRRAYASWGIVLYLLGVILMVQVAELWGFAH